MNKYKIFGYNVVSEIHLDCYEHDFLEEDVSIVVKVPQTTIKTRVSYFELGREKTVFSIDDIGHFEIEKGSKIIVTPDFHIDEKKLEIYILGTCFGAIMIQRNEFPLHGSFIYNGEKGIGIVGESEAGKTTLAAAMVKEDWKIVTDDVIRVKYHQDVPEVFPSYPSQKLWSSAAKMLNLNIVSSKAVHNRIDKFYYSDSKRFFSENARLNILIEIVPSDVGCVEIEVIEKQKSLNVLLSNTYRYEIIDYSRKHKEHLIFISRLCSDIDVYRIRRPRKGYTVNDEVKAIQKILLLK